MKNICTLFHSRAFFFLAYFHAARSIIHICEKRKLPLKSKFQNFSDFFLSPIFSSFFDSLLGCELMLQSTWTLIEHSILNELFDKKVNQYFSAF